jgi:hypothetical protein
MQKFNLYLFAIPILSMIVIGLYQFFDEMFKKEFRLERRTGRPAGEVTTRVPQRRYSDSVPPGTPSKPETAASATTNEVSVPQVNGV